LKEAVDFERGKTEGSRARTVASGKASAEGVAESSSAQVLEMENTNGINRDRSKSNKEKGSDARVQIDVEPLHSSRETAPTVTYL
jgi:hypothetical protein